MDRSGHMSGSMSVTLPSRCRYSFHSMVKVRPDASPLPCEPDPHGLEISEKSIALSASFAVRKHVYFLTPKVREKSLLNRQIIMTMWSSFFSEMHAVNCVALLLLAFHYASMTISVHSPDFMAGWRRSASSLVFIQLDSATWVADNKRALISNHVTASSVVCMTLISWHCLISHSSHTHVAPLQ